MLRRVLSPAVLASLAAGIGLWCTRATLDVTTSQGRVVRVAMLPSWPDLVGGTAAVLLAVFLLRAAIVRGARRHVLFGIPTRTLFDRVLAPLFLVLALGLPFLPWLPDLIPVLRVLAGPAAFFLWTLAIGSVVWTVWDARAERRPRTGRVPPGAVAVVFGLSLLVYGAAAQRLAGTVVYPGGDEPHYLVITQSLLHDRSLAIEATHQRGDYRAYFPNTLRPDYRTRGTDGRIYSIHPVGLPIIAAPAFALAGYRGVVWLLVVIAAAGAATAWWATARLTGQAAATVAWMATALSPSFVLHSFAVYPEVIAGTCTVLALWCFGDRSRTQAAGGPASGSQQTMTWVASGLLAGALPWLGTKYAPMSGVVVLALLLRARRSGLRAVLAVAVPYGAAVIAWLAFFYVYWGSPLPSVPYGSDHQTALTHMLVGVPGVFFDQEYGLVAYAPALLFAIPGLVWLWRDGGAHRSRAIEASLAFLALTLTVGAFAIWWGGSAPPGRELVAGILLLALPIARADAGLVERPALRWMLRLLTLLGITIALTMSYARGGLLIANGRDGQSSLLEWLLPTEDLVRVMPSGIAGRTDPITFFGLLLTWALVAALAVAAAARLRGRRHAVLSACALLLAVLVGGSAVSAMVWGGRLLKPVDPAHRGEAPILSEFDGRRRPISIAYDAFRRIPGEAVAPLFPLTATPGQRTDPQPLRVLLNMRVALPAGRYTMRLDPRPGVPLSGRIGLQVGRTGDPLHVWEIHPQADGSWSVPFHLGVDSNFVGARGPQALEHAIGRLTFVPDAVVNASDRVDVPPVLGARSYGNTVVFFHTGGVYPEEAGFWVRGRSTAVATFAPDGRPISGPGLHLKLHSAVKPVRVRLSEPRWTTDVTLDPVMPRDVYVPARPGTAAVPLEITPLDGFVPHDAGLGTDTRLLGCWVEVVPQ